MPTNKAQNWDDLGKSIEDIINKAVNSKDFQKLNQMVSQIVEKANSASSTAEKPGPVPYASSRHTHNVVMHSSSSKSTRVNSPRTEKLPAVYGNTGGITTKGILKIVGGGILSLCSSIGLLFAILGAIIAEVSVIIPSAVLLGLGACGGLLIKSGVCNLTYISRFKTYMKTIGQKTYCNLNLLSRSVQKSEKYVRKELQKMINQGLFLEGHLDAEESCLITSDETYRYYENCKNQAQSTEQQEPKTEDTKAVNSGIQEVLDKGERFLRQIHKCNQDIPGESITKKISHMELLIAGIFEQAEAHPEIVPDLKKLMDYYLPMTVKLLTAYAEMDRQPIQGDTILASKREIENTLDTLNTAFEKLLDSVFKETAMDVSSDISVLQTLLAKEGLTEDELAKLKKESDKTV